jgi:hypothetical protein
MKRAAWAGIGLLVAGMSAAQTSLGAPPPMASQSSVSATVSYEVDSANRDPAKYSLTIDGAGHAVYTAADKPDPKTSPDDDIAPAPPYRVEFEVSPPTRERLFSLAQQLNYFAGDYEFRKHKIADTGQKTLRYHDPTRDTSTVFHWSENREIQDISNIFESIALTQALARKIQFMRRFDKLGLDDVLKRMEDLQRQNDLLEIQSIAPTLRLVANDTSLMHVARERAARLLDQIDAAQSAAPPSTPRQP